MSDKEKEIFEQAFYYKCFLQEGIDEYNKIIGELNKRVKELRDKKEKGRNFRKTDYSLFKTLHKQILGNVRKERQTITKKEDVFPIFRDFVRSSKTFFDRAKKLMNAFTNNEFADYYENIYLKNTAINTISHRWFTSDNGFNFEMALPQKSKRNYERDIPKVKTFVSLSDVQKAINKLEGEIFKDNYAKIIKSANDKWSQFLRIWKNEFEILWDDKKSNEEVMQVGFQNALKYAEKYLEENKEFTGRKEEIEIIKNLADAGLKIYQMFKYFALEAKKQDEIPAEFSTDFYEKYDELLKIFSRGGKEDYFKYYNALRNFLTKKLSDEDKIKLNFECGQLLSGFDKNKESEKLGIILRKNNKYFLGILNKDYNHILNEEKFPEAYKESCNSYEKMEYKLFPDAKRMIPKIAFAENNKRKFGWNKDIQDIKDEYALFQEKKKNDKDLRKSRFDKKKEQKLIAYYQNCLLKGGYKAIFGFKWRKPEEYKSVGEFNNDIDQQGYSLKFICMNDKYIQDKVKDGELYLFEISNKDFQKSNKNTMENLHTIYFKNLFPSKPNEKLEKPILKLSGNAEIFLREKVENLPKSKDRYGKRIIKHKRYSENKIFLYLPIVINMGKENSGTQKFNQETREKLKKIMDSDEDAINIIGIDRGEKHLAYYSVINRKGEILDQGSLNEINGIDYYKLLHEREKERLKNRQSWEPIAKIKDLKKGYISHIIHKISKLVIEHNAILVLEDLNMRFKQIRSGIEKSVYQQLEKALIDKFGYLVFKNRNLEEPGGALNGYQLSAPFESFQKIEKQTGIIFYTQAEYTSVTDPVAGFRKNIYISNSAPLKKIKKNINLFKEIAWDQDKESYFFRYDAKDFDNGKDTKSREWKIYADIPRIQRKKENGHWHFKSVNPNEMLKDLFKLWGFEHLEGDILKQIKNKNSKGELEGKKIFDSKESSFYHSLIYIFNLILQLRNSFSKQIRLGKDGKIEEVGEDIDFIASPVVPFFTTASKYSKLNLAGLENKIIHNKEKIINEFNGDANGSYNIARKGIIILEKIQKNSEEQDLFITKRQWDDFVQKSAQSK